jgi:hypothetical protein
VLNVGGYLVSLVDLSKLPFQCCNSLIGLCLGAKKVFFRQLFKSIAFKSCLGVLLFTCCACTFQGKVLAKFGTFNTCNLILPHFIQRCYLGCTNLNNSENYFNAATSTKMLCMMQNTLTVLRIISTLQPPPCMKRKITCVVCWRSK